MVKKQLSWMLCLLMVGLLFSNCLRKGPLPLWVSKISMMQTPIGPEEIFRLPEGDRLTFEELLNDLLTTRVIFVGESHDQIEHHLIQLKILKGLLEKGKGVVVAMEMFERAQQSILDRWSRGLLTEETFLKEVHWETTWGMDYHLYKGILDQVKKHHLKLIGLNIPRNLVRKVAQNGIEGLPPEDKKGLPQMDLQDRGHRAYMKSIYKSHQGGVATDFEKFYEAQSLWDEGMAETLSEFLKSPEGQGKTGLIFVGNGHMIFHFGIPNRFYRRTSIPYQTIVLKEWKESIDEDFTFDGASSPLANFLWVTRSNPPAKKPSRIGLIFKPAEDQKGLCIERVIPHSPAEKAGLLPGDLLMMVEGKEISKAKDIHDAVVQKGLGKEMTFTIIREGVRKEVIVILPEK